MKRSFDTRCRECNGAGWVSRSGLNVIGASFEHNYKACPVCGGTGEQTAPEPATSGETGLGRPKG